MKKTISVQIFVAAAVMTGALCLLPGGTTAQVSGVCSDCHTMHNSQNGTAEVTGGPFRALTKGDCIICHSTSSTTGNTGSTTPYVLHTAGVTYTDPVNTTGDTLAGGNFYWVNQAGGDPKGHNVIGLKGGTANADGTLGNTPPGGSALAAQLTCAGINGCHGDRTVADDFTAVSGSHHANDATIDGATSGTSYRFLKGILGKEAADWEHRATASAHNQYKGATRANDATVTASTISALCGQCHGTFHAGANNISYGNNQSSPWVRHPTDFDMQPLKAAGKEYGAYNDPTNSGTNAYSLEAPVASTDVSAVKSAVMVAAGDAIVTCISCHRAHGSPNDDLLRWDYSTMNAHAGTSNRGCFVCHTTKDS